MASLMSAGSTARHPRSRSRSRFSLPRRRTDSPVRFEHRLTFSLSSPAARTNIYGYETNLMACSLYAQYAQCSSEKTRHVPKQTNTPNDTCSEIFTSARQRCWTKQKYEERNTSTATDYRTRIGPDNDLHRGVCGRHNCGDIQVNKRRAPSPNLLHTAQRGIHTHSKVEIADGGTTGGNGQQRAVCYASTEHVQHNQ